MLGVELQQLPYLLVLSGLFLLLIALNNAVKFVLNLYKSIVGERMLRRLRFRPRVFRKTGGDQLMPVIASEAARTAASWRIASDSRLLEVLRSEGLFEPLIALGAEAADMLIAALLDGAPDAEPLDLQSPLDSGSLDRLCATLAGFLPTGAKPDSRKASSGSCIVATYRSAWAR